ncbi:MAG: plasmid pRiA4b ORF-3 family protein [Clostridia bacterium]
MGDTMELEYDYGAGWFFDIELICVKPMVKGTGNHYPYVTDGAVLGIIEGFSAGEWAEYIKTVDKTGVPPIYYDVFYKEVIWDYKRFDIDITNALLKRTVKRMKRIYEDLFE